MTAVAKRLMTFDEYLAFAGAREGRWELEDGVVYGMAPERIAHSDAKFAVVAALRAAIARAGCPCHAVLDGPAVRISARTAYQPDALVYCGQRRSLNTLEISDPVIVVEVLSPSTFARDQSLKLAGYFSLPSLAHYLILAPEARMAIHHKRGEGALIETRIAREGALRLDPPGLDLAVEDLFAEA